MTVPAEGAVAPPFTLPDSSGKDVSLTDFAGKTVVLYFYPKDDTPGCAAEACEFRDSHRKITGRNAVVLGISPDSGESHTGFSRKFGLPFVLLSDTDHAVAGRYGAWGEKIVSGKRSTGILRTTFIIDGQGRIAKVFRNVKPEGHAAEVLAAL